MRASWYFWLVSLQTYMSRIALPGRDRLAFWNHGCWSGGGVIADGELIDHPHAAAVRLRDELAHIGQLAVHRVHVPVIGDVVAVVAKWGGVEGQQPDRADPELLEVGQLVDQALKVAAAVAVAVVEGSDMNLVDDRVLVPERIVVELEKRLSGLRRLVVWIIGSTRNRARCGRGAGT